MKRDIDFLTAWGLSNPLFVDVRSEDEFLEDHIPNAINIPLLNNKERKETGTIYKQIAPKEARKYCLAVVSQKLPQLIEALEKLAQQGTIVLYCWRGGDRSRSLQVILELMRIPCFRLTNGYKEYRALVNTGREEKFAFPVVVLHGLTGVGKTRVLKELAKLNSQVLDLEGLAGNRGSAFGNVGLPEQPSQKFFETKIWQQLQTFDPLKPIIVECESKRIGRLLVPNALFKAMKAGKHILVYDTIPNRITKIMQDYCPQQQQTEIIEAITRLKDKLGKNIVDGLIEMVIKGQYREVVEVLLLKYYDPLYTYPDEPTDQFIYSVSSGECIEAAKNIENFLTDTMQ